MTEEISQEISQQEYERVLDMHIKTVSDILEQCQRSTEILKSQINIARLLVSSIINNQGQE